MNYIALNQTIFKKHAVLGQGFKGGNRNTACSTISGYCVWINGYNDMPDVSEIIQHTELGCFEYPHLMPGMADGGGEIKYWFGITQWEYVLIVGISLNEDDSDEYAMDVASMVFIDRVPMLPNKHQENQSQIAGELLLAHFAHFLGNNNVAEFEACVHESNSRLLISTVKYYRQHAEQELNHTLRRDYRTEG